MKAHLPLWAKLDIYMRVLDLTLLDHKTCENREHYVIFFNGMIFVLHPDEADQCDGDILMQTISSDKLNLSSSQREMIQNRLESILKGNL